MTTIDDRILNKIKKCIALGQSSEPHEAAAALRQAQKLMEQYGVSQADLGRSEIGEAKVKSKASVSRVKDWELRLINLVARAFGCKLLWTRSSSYRTGDAIFGHYTLIGLKTQVELAQYTSEVLLRKLIKARQQFVNQLPGYYSRQAKTREADGFCQGWTERISETVVSFAVGEETLKLIEDFVSARSHGNAKVQQRRAGIYGFEHGAKAAAGESLFRPVNQRAPAPMIGQ